MKIAKVISGGQTGADQAGLFAGRACGIETGGKAPKGWRTEKGSAPWLKDYGLSQSGSSAYPPRTEYNVSTSDLTIVLGNHKSPGCKLTIRHCRGYERDYLVVNNFDDRDFVKCYLHIMNEMPGGLIVNIAGNREESTPGIGKKAERFLIRLFNKVNEDYEIARRLTHS